MKAKRPRMARGPSKGRRYLSRAQQKAIFAKAKLTAAYTQHHKLVHAEVAATIRRHAGLSQHRADLTQAGLVGLLEHAKRYNPKKSKFSTLAVKRIHRHVLRASKELLGTGGLKVGERKIVGPKKTDKLPTRVSMETRGPKGMKLRKEIAALMTPGDHAARTHARIDLSRIMKVISQREREVVQRRFLHEEPVKAIAQAMRLSATRVKKIQAAAMKKMRAHVRKEAA